MNSKNAAHFAWLCLGVFVTLILGQWLDPQLAWADGRALVEGSKVHTFENSKPVALVFWVCAAGAIGGSLFVITRRNMVTAVMGMVGTFFAIGGLYLMLYASFLAVMQVLVYAGAIMVLFVFVIMILNRPEDEPWALEGLFGKAIAALGMLYLLKRLAGILWTVKDTHPLVLSKEALNASVVLNPADPLIQESSTHLIERSYEFGSVRGVGYTLFTDYLFPFEAVSIVLLVAVVGAVAIARPKEDAEPVSSDNTGAQA